MLPLSADIKVFVSDFISSINHTYISGEVKFIAQATSLLVIFLFITFNESRQNILAT